MAVWFHLAAESRDALQSAPILAGLSVLLGLNAAWVLWQPGKRRVLGSLCMLVPLHALTEAPVVGNHWILAALVCLNYLISRWAMRKREEVAWANAFFSGTRLTVLAAYGFAAFAKLNSDFLDPAVSCVPIFEDRMVRSWGRPELSVIGKVQFSQFLAGLTVVTELSVAGLLALPATRRAGLVLGICFHWLLALDMGQHFWDFSSVLFAVFSLFLDDGQVRWLRQSIRKIRTELEHAWGGRAWIQSKHAWLWGLLAAGAGLSTGLLNILPARLGYAATLTQLGHTVWWLYGTAVMVLVVLASGAARLPSLPTPRVWSPLLLLIPALSVFNGLSPYLELKTGFGWNMYSNLRTVGGQTNHLLLPRTLELWPTQRQLVQVLSSTDHGLQQLHDEDYALTLAGFRDYARRFPDSALSYRWQGQVYHSARLADDPLAQPERNIAAVKLLPFRPVDLQAHQRCQALFTPAQ